MASLFGEENTSTHATASRLGDIFSRMTAQCKADQSEALVLTSTKQTSCFNASCG